MLCLPRWMPLVALMVVALLCSAVSQQPGALQTPPLPPVPLALRPDCTPLYPKLKEAFLFAQSGKLDQAGAGYRAALERGVASEDRPAQALAHSGLAFVWYRKANYPAAKVESEQALTLYRLLQDPVSEAQTSTLLGNISNAMGDRPMAREYYHAALASFESLRMLKEKADMLINLELAGEQDGEKLLEEALAISRQIENGRLQAAALHNLGDHLFSQGRFDAALEKYSQAASLYEKLGDQADLARVLTSEGRLQRAHGHPEEALPLYQQALVVQQKAGDRAGAMQSINAMAATFEYLGDHGKSAEVYLQGLAMAKETGSPILIDLELAGLASAYLGLGKSREAVDILEKVAPEDQADAAYDYLNLGVGYASVGRLHEGLEADAKAIKIAQGENNLDLLPAAFRRRAEVEEKLGMQPEALADARESLGLIEEVRMHLVPTDFMKSGFSEGTQETYSLLVRLLEHAGQPGQAMEVAEKARARASLDLLATRKLEAKDAGQAQLPSLARGGDETSAGRVDQASADPASSSLSGLLTRGGSPAGAVKRQTAGSGLPSLQSVQAYSLPEIQATARRLRSTILSYWVEDDAIYIWVVPSEGMIRTAMVPCPRKRLEELIHSLDPAAAPGGAAPQVADDAARDGAPSSESGVMRAARAQQLNGRGGTLLSVTSVHAKSWRELYRLLIEPVETWLPPQTESLLTLEPSGPLLKLPFAGLKDKRGHYLLERYSLHYTPAVSLLQFTQSRQQEAKRIRPRYLLVADPSRMPPGPDKGALPSLPGARHEVAAVARLLPAKDVTLLEGTRASEREVLKAAGESSFIHLATHGIIRDDQPFESFLALGGSETDPKLDGRLTAQKVYDLELHADLVFLSACRSGSGKATGDGLVGLTRAFWYAGTPSVIASLWDVADEPTYRLVADFYRSLLQGNDKNHALRSAQLRLLHQLRAAQVKVNAGSTRLTLPEDPIFWASFVLQGEP